MRRDDQYQNYLFNMEIIQKLIDLVCYLIVNKYIKYTCIYKEEINTKLK